MSTKKNKKKAAPEVPAKEAAPAPAPAADAPGEEVREVVFEEALAAMLFAAGHPLSYATIARVLQMTPGKVKDLTFEYSLKYNHPDIPRGVILLTFPDACQLCTKEYYLHEIRDALGVRKSGSLSSSAMETLAIVAYNQPVTRIFVDTLRRADSSYAMNNLLDRGLIECVGRMDAPGRPMLYGTTKDFLRCFGLSDISELPTASEDVTNMFAGASNAEEVAEGEETEPLDTGADVTDTGTKEAAASATEAPAEPTDEPSAEDDIHDEPSAEDDIPVDDLSEDEPAPTDTTKAITESETVPADTTETDTKSETFSADNGMLPEDGEE